jgi:prepilin-type N-terminal cleavage/methylation domain-containing protein
MKRLRNNKGITLIEILVALVILSLLMTAVISLMMNNNIIFRKTKNDIKVQSQADETYNFISDVILTAKYIYVEGYTGDAEVSFSKTEVGADTSVIFTDVKARSNVVDMTSTTNTFDSDEINLKDIYVKKLIVVSSVPIDSQVIKPSSDTTVSMSSGDIIYNTFPLGTQGPDKRYSMGTIQIDNQDAALKLKDDIPDMTTDTNSHDVIVGDSDRCIYTFYFSKNGIYVTKRYMYQNSLDTIAAPSDDPESWDPEVQNSLKISNSLNYVVDNSGNYVSGAVFKFDRSKNGAGIKLYFNDSNMTYTVENMVRIHNSGVVGGVVGVE